MPDYKRPRRFIHVPRQTPVKTTYLKFFPININNTINTTIHKRSYISAKRGTDYV
jgi:hypothetical protein